MCRTSRERKSNDSELRHIRPPAAILAWSRRVEPRIAAKNAARNAEKLA